MRLHGKEKQVLQWLWNVTWATKFPSSFPLPSYINSCFCLLTHAQRSAFLPLHHPFRPSIVQPQHPASCAKKNKRSRPMGCTRSQTLESQKCAKTCVASFHFFFVLLTNGEPDLELQKIDKLQCWGQTSYRFSPMFGFPYLPSHNLNNELIFHLSKPLFSGETTTALATLASQNGPGNQPITGCSAGLHTLVGKDQRSKTSGPFFGSSFLRQKPKREQAQDERTFSMKRPAMIDIMYPDFESFWKLSELNEEFWTLTKQIQTDFDS